MSNKITPGERIAELCKTYTLSYETLSERSGLSLQQIMSIVNGSIPDLAPLIKISRAMGVRLGTLLDDHENLGPVITRAGEAELAPRFITGLAGAGTAGGAAEAGTPAGLRFHALAPDKGGRHMEPFIVDIEADAEQRKSTHEGEEFVHVIAGALLLEYGLTSYNLGAGDSIYYDSIVPHRLLSADKKPVRILAVIYTPA
jgi:transcriptional regulator with XRE-family HTH domain